jgi:AraC-like DNA-binding protein
MLGFAVMASRTIREALLLIAKYLNIRTPLLGLTIINKERYIEVQLSERYRLDVIQRPLLESAISALTSMLNQIAAELAPIKKIKLPFNQPSYVSEYHSQFKCEIEFSAPIAALVIPNEVLDVPLKLGNESAYRNAVEICDKELLKLTQEQTVQHKIRSLLLESVEQFPTLKQVASHLHLSPRTMHRCLQKERTSFSKILSDVRYLRAQSMLANRHFAIAEIGRQLGYCEPASFRKAFRGWSNMSPKQFRSQFK